MASPAAPLTPPAEPGSTQTLSQSQAQSSTQAQTSQPQNSTHGTTGSGNARVEALLAAPLTSLTDDGTSRRPRDHRLIHLLLASHGVNAYQERVPLQLMDFAYRYTSTILSDALHMQMEGYDQALDNAAGASGGKKGGAKGNNANRSDEGDISLPALKMAIQSRLAHQFTGQANMPKEFLKGLADDRNRISLGQHAKDAKGDVGATIGGLKLPHERYCLTGQGWGLKNEWESEGEESDGEDGTTGGQHQTGMTGEGEGMQLDDADEDMGEDEDGEGKMEDLFGADDGDGDRDAEMQDS